MIWGLLTILAAFGQATKNALSKKLVRGVDKYTVAMASVLSIAVASLLLALLFSDSLVPQPGFWLPFVVVVFLIAVSTVIMVHAFSMSDLSLVIPLMNFSTIFTLLLSPVLIGEFPNFTQLIGISTVVVGSYILNISRQHVGFLAPLKALLKDRGAMLMLLVAAIWGLDSVVSKIGLQYSDPFTWTAYTRIAVSLIYFPLVLRNDRAFPDSVKQNSRTFLMMGSFLAASVILFYITLPRINVSVHSALMRNDTLFGVFYGWWMFKESGISARLGGALIMVAGSLLIIFS